jgi:hypothetical protein
VDEAAGEKDSCSEPPGTRFGSNILFGRGRTGEGSAPSRSRPVRIVPSMVGRNLSEPGQEEPGPVEVPKKWVTGSPAQMMCPAMSFVMSQSQYRQWRPRSTTSNRLSMGSLVLEMQPGFGQRTTPTRDRGISTPFFSTTS